MNNGDHIYLRYTSELFAFINMFSLLNAYLFVLGIYFAQIFGRISYAFGPFEGNVDCHWSLYFPSFGAELDH